MTTDVDFHRAYLFQLVLRTVPMYFFWFCYVGLFGFGADPFDVLGFGALTVGFILITWPLYHRCWPVRVRAPDGRIYVFRRRRVTEEGEEEPFGIDEFCARTGVGMNGFTWTGSCYGLLLGFSMIPLFVVSRLWDYGIPPFLLVVLGAHKPG